MAGWPSGPRPEAATAGGDRHQWMPTGADPVSPKCGARVARNRASRPGVRVSGAASSLRPIQAERSGSLVMALFLGFGENPVRMASVRACGIGRCRPAPGGPLDPVPGRGARADTEGAGRHLMMPVRHPGRRVPETIGGQARRAGLHGRGAGRIHRRLRLRWHLDPDPFRFARTHRGLRRGKTDAETPARGNRQCLGFVDGLVVGAATGEARGRAVIPVAQAGGGDVDRRSDHPRRRKDLARGLRGKVAPCPVRRSPCVVGYRGKKGGAVIAQHSLRPRGRPERP